MTDFELAEYAHGMLTYSYSPYSKFQVGAALLCKNGNIYKGCNIENASYSATVCAERVAIFSAVSKGEKEFEKIVIATNTLDFTPPCGICRQVMSEFMDKNFKIILSNKNKELKTFTLEELFPNSFTKDNM